MAALGLLFPSACVGCRRGRWPLCAACLDRVPVITPPLCARCGRPTAAPVRGCDDCPPPPVARARSPFGYRGPLAAAIRGLKFSGWRALAPVLARGMAAVLGSPSGEGVMTWVPLAPRRRARRGFDQAEVLARALASTIGLPVRPLLERVRDTPAQARRGGEERRSALQGAFRVRRLPPASVVLVDDVLTTGSTAAACAGALLRAGAERVDLVTAARSLARFPARCWGPAGGGA